MISAPTAEHPGSPAPRDVGDAGRERILVSRSRIMGMDTTVLENTRAAKHPAHQQETTNCHCGLNTARHHPRGGRHAGIEEHGNTTSDARPKSRPPARSAPAPACSCWTHADPAGDGHPQIRRQAGFTPAAGLYRPMARNGPHMRSRWPATWCTRSRAKHPAQYQRYAPKARTDRRRRYRARPTGRHTAGKPAKRS